MKKFLAVLCAAVVAFVVYGCGDETATGPLGFDPATVPTNSVDQAVASAQPEFHSLTWPAPTYIPSVMTMDKHDGAATVVTVLDVPLAPPGWSGEYPGFATPYGIAFDVDGTAYTLNNWFDGVPSDCFSQLARIDLQTGAMEPIGPVHDINFAGPEFDAYGNLYATGFTVGAPEGGPIYVWGDSYLYRINKNTGEKTAVGDTGHTEWMDLEFDSQGRLWATFANDLYIIDTQTGASQFVTHVDGVEDNRIPGVCEEDWAYMEIMGMAFDHNGVLWATAMKGFSLCEEGGLAAPVMTIDIEAGQAHLVGSTLIDGQSHGGDTPPRDVKICHLKGNGAYVPLTVSLSSLSTHLDHGDHLTTSPDLTCHTAAEVRQITVGH